MPISTILNLMYAFNIPLQTQAFKMSFTQLHFHSDQASTVSRIEKNVVFLVFPSDRGDRRKDLL